MYSLRNAKKTFGGSTWALRCWRPMHHSAPCPLLPGSQRFCAFPLLQSPLYLILISTHSTYLLCSWSLCSPSRPGSTCPSSRSIPSPCTSGRSDASRCTTTAPPTPPGRSSRCLRWGATPASGTWIWKMDVQDRPLNVSFDSKCGQMRLDFLLRTQRRRLPSRPIRPGRAPPNTSPTLPSPGPLRPATPHVSPAHPSLPHTLLTAHRDVGDGGRAAHCPSSLTPHCLCPTPPCSTPPHPIQPCPTYPTPSPGTPTPPRFTPPPKHQGQRFCIKCEILTHTSHPRPLPLQLWPPTGGRAWRTWWRWGTRSLRRGGGAAGGGRAPLRRGDETPSPRGTSGSASRRTTPRPSTSSSSLWWGLQTWAWVIRSKRLTAADSRSRLWCPFSPPPPFVCVCLSLNLLKLFLFDVSSPGTSACVRKPSLCGS